MYSTRSVRFRILTLALLCASAGFAASDQGTAESHSAKGLQLAQAGDLAGAESELRAAVAHAPNNPEFLTNLATVLAIEKKLEDSTQIFKRALKLDPRNLTARRYLAANLWQLRRYPEARENLEIILQQKNDDAPSRLLLGMVAENMKAYRTAARMLASVPEEVRKQPESIAALAASYYHLGEREKARRALLDLENHPAGARAVLLGAEIADENAAYDTAEQLLLSIKQNYPDQGDLSYRSAIVEFHAHKFEESEQTLLPVVASGQATAEIFNLLGWCYQKLGRSEPAIDAFEKAIILQPNQESNYLDLEKVLLAQGKVAAALEVAKRATEACPSSARVFTKRGELEVQASQFTNAVASYRRAVEIDPRNADAALGLADAEFAAGMRKEAYTGFEAGIRQFTKDARFPLHYASALLKESETGDLNAERRGKELLISAVKLDPSSADAHYQLGQLAFKDGQFMDALRDYQTAATLDPKNPKVHFGLSNAYRRLGKREEATRETRLFQELQTEKPGPSPPSPGDR